MTDAPAEVVDASSCRTCGACCYGAIDGRVLVYAEDLLRWKREGRTDIIAGLVPGHFGELAFPYHESGACKHLGTPGHPNDCGIYPTRGASCHALVPGSSMCLSYRRDRGIA